jgi:hypothetical protein
VSWARAAHDENHKRKVRSHEDQRQNGGGVALQDVGELKHSSALSENKRAASRARLGTSQDADFALQEHGVAHCHDVETFLKFLVDLRNGNNCNLS